MLFRSAGCGYGGSCFPKDVRALLHTAREDAGQTLHVLEAVQQANEVQKRVLTAKVQRRFGADLSGRHFAVWGLAFKPNTDDMREAPAVLLIEDLLQAGATVSAYDPVARKEAHRLLGHHTGLTLVDSAPQALEAADALVIVTEWKEFRSPDFEAISKTLKSPVIFDGRNLYDPAMLSEFGIEYHGVGRGTGALQ